ncbi:uncharacterized protein [Nicotiana tomentosiformis]|uniref:uncharacterized protein n=1 Tax=Nicotiana tomentosiformis TaxID=4098 RepID=UPI00388C4227
MDVSRESLGAPLCVSTLVGDSVIVDRVYQSCIVTFCGHETRAGLLLLDMNDFEVILGMDWLSPYHAILDFHAKCWTHGREGLFAAETPTIDSVHVVREFSDVFPSDLPDIPLYRDINFSIDLAPCTHLISVPSYHMAPKELKELKEQLEELLINGFIRSSVSPWGAPVLFVKRRMRVYRCALITTS